VVGFRHVGGFIRSILDALVFVAGMFAFSTR
jgi:hypothetical protein